MDKAWHGMTADETAAKLSSSAKQGLSSAETASRLKQYGLNQLRETNRDGRRNA